MALRMTGLMSGLDTESIVAALMETHKAKKHKVDSKKQKLEWTQEIWSSLNTKIYNFYKDYAGKMRFQTNYKTKKAVSSDSAKVTATAGNSATNGTYRVNVTSLAKAQYVTSGKLPTEYETTVNGETVTKKVTTSTKLSDLGMTVDGSGQIQVTSGDKTVSLNIDADTTISDFLSSLQNAGLTASFDQAQGRFFISSKNSGADQSFTIQYATLDANQQAAQQAIKDAVGYDKLSDTQKKKVKDLLNTIQNGTKEDKVESAIKTLQDMVDANAKTQAKEYYENKYKEERIDQYAERNADGSFKQLKEEGKQALIDAGIITDYDEQRDTYVESYKSSFVTNDEETGAAGVSEKGREALIEAGIITEEDTRTSEQLLQDYGAQLDALAEEKADSEMVGFAATLAQKEWKEYSKTDEYTAEIDRMVAEGINDGETQLASQADRNAAIDSAVRQYATEIGNGVSAADSDVAAAELGHLGLDTIDGTEREEVDGDGMVVVAASDAKVQVNGATLTASTNTIEVNGLTLNLTDLTDGEITITVSDDTDAVYDSIKEFINQYNAILSEMNKLFNADSSRGYDVLTEDQEDEMSEKDIEKWNTKIKDSLLRRDSTLEGLINTLREISGTTVTASNGKRYSLAMLGITMGKDYKENGLLHIKGDEDDTDYADSENILMKMLKEDPDTVTEVMAGLTTQLYNTLTKKMQSSTLSSALTFYNDKEMNKQLSQYNKDIKKWETKLKDIEDRYYNQFTAMEKALSRMNSQQSALAGYMGW